MTEFNCNGEEQADFWEPWPSILEWIGDVERDRKSSWEPCVKKIHKSWQGKEDFLGICFQYD